MSGVEIMNGKVTEKHYRGFFNKWIHTVLDQRQFRQWARADRPFPPPENIRHLIQAERINDYHKWLKAGKPLPPPHLVKQEMVKQYANTYQTNVLIETGTFRGEMIDACATLFKRIFSIELSNELFQEASKRFAHQKHISIMQGDSGKIMPEILSKINEPCLFWLDGHYSGGFTAKGSKETPILQELAAILKHPVEHHVVLIDDARCFNGENDYPTINELKNMILPCHPDWFFEIEDDAIRTARRQKT